VDRDQEAHAPVHHGHHEQGHPSIFQEQLSPQNLSAEPCPLEQDLLI
jgi:hypothetical protein